MSVNDRLERLEKAMFAGDVDVGMALTALYQVVQRYIQIQGDNAHDLMVVHSKMMHEMGHLFDHLTPADEDPDTDDEPDPALRLVPDPEDEG